jgi:TPR repeat protein
MRYCSQLARVTLATSLTLVTMVANAGPFEDALAAAQSGDYATANWLLRPLADQGDAIAQYDLGFMYDTGHGVMQNYDEAMRWYRLAANQGNALAQFNLGFMYANGHGVPQDYAEAAKWYLLSAKQGCTWAQFYLGFFWPTARGCRRIRFWRTCG